MLDSSGIRNKSRLWTNSNQEHDDVAHLYPEENLLVCLIKVDTAGIPGLLLPKTQLRQRQADWGKFRRQQQKLLDMVFRNTKLQGKTGRLMLVQHGLRTERISQK